MMRAPCKGMNGECVVGRSAVLRLVRDSGGRGGHRRFHTDFYANKGTIKRYHNTIMQLESRSVVTKASYVGLPLLGRRETSVEQQGNVEEVYVVDEGTKRLSVSQETVLAIAGGGIFFFWELGVLKYLLRNFRLQDVKIVGASAGALCAVLVASGVDLDRAVRKAYDISMANDIWTRPSGLAGIWGGLVREWLEELLPENAHVLCKSRVQVIATKVPSMRLEYLDSFDSRSDLINACMASIHIPFFLDGNGTYLYRGKQYIDGSVWDFFSGSNSKLLTKGGTACVIDYFMDEQLQFDRLDFIKTASYDSVLDLVRSGYSYAERTDAKGMFDSQLGNRRKWIVRRLAEAPVHQLSNAVNAISSWL